MMRLLRKIFVVLLLVAVYMTANGQTFAENSVLRDGTIYKIGVTETAIYRITFEELEAAGVDVSSLDIDKISMYGNIAGMLPEDNSAVFYDDLTEMSISVDDDGIVFYGQSPVEWTFTNDRYVYGTNYYTDTTFYFLKIDNQTNGKRMSVKEQSSADAVGVVNSFLDKQYHEIDLSNYYHRGRKWYGEKISGENQEVTIPFVFKNVEKNKIGSVKTCFVGASKKENFYVSLKVNGSAVTDDIFIKKAGDYYYGEEKNVEALFNPNDDILNVSLEVLTENTSTFVTLDYICVNAWRTIKYADEQLHFSLSDMGHPVVKTIKVGNAEQDMLVYDVSKALEPEIQDFEYVGGEIRFKDMSNFGNSYVVAKSSDIQSVKSIYPIENQNLHSLYGGEMLIVTDKIFATQAEEIKAIHEEEDGLYCEVVFVDEIFNEFSSGARDITGIRNFIRMIYQRSSDLKYVLLLGRGENDFKNIEGYGTNFVPPYEAYNTVNEILAYVTDDYYGIMDDGEGASCAGLLDLGIGRIPVINEDEAEVVVDKIRRYISSVKTMGGWRNNILLLSDDKKMYSDGCEAIEKIVDTLKPFVNVDKIYADVYIRKTMSTGGYYYPDVTESIIDKYNDGIMMMSYLGHGGVQGLSASNIFRIKDIGRLTNYYQLPFVATGTCEFSAFDDATFVSAGERLFKMNEGGAIAMFTTTRPTSSPVNQAVLKNFHKQVFTGDNIRMLAFGDFVCLTKNNNGSNSSNYLSYVMFGDPALRFSYPKSDIIIELVNGMTPEEPLVVAPMDSIHVEGYICNGMDGVDDGFNGVICPKMFDNKAKYQTLNNDGATGNQITFSCYKDVIYEGKASVTNGRFSFTFLVPRSVNNQSGYARMSFYAMDTVRKIDATGFYKKVSIGGTSDVPMDNEGPEIELLWNGENVVEGEVPNFGQLSATIHDPQGIYHYNSVIGRDVMITVKSEESVKTMNVNRLFEPAMDDFTRGTLSIDFEELDEGPNLISLRAWDTHDNSNTASILVNVARKHHEKKILNVRNYPNPFRDKTCFTIEYNNSDVVADVLIKIYDVSGRIVNVLEYNGLSTPILNMEWSASDMMGNNLGAGVYIYKVYVSDSDGNSYNTAQRMIIL